MTLSISVCSTASSPKSAVPQFDSAAGRASQATTWTPTARRTPIIERGKMPVPCPEARASLRLRLDRHPIIFHAPNESGSMEFRPPGQCPSFEPCALFKKGDRQCLRLFGEVGSSPVFHRREHPAARSANCQPIPKGATGRAKDIYGVWFYVKMIPPGSKD